MRHLDPQSLVGHADRLHGAAWALRGSRQDAEDLVQETFTRVLARLRLLRGEPSELAYLMRVLHNTFLSGRRDASRRLLVGRLAEEETPQTEAPPSAPRVQTREPSLTAGMSKLAA